MDYYDDNDNDSKQDESGQNGSSPENPRQDSFDDNSNYWQSNSQQQNSYQPGSYSRKNDRPIPQTNRMALFSMLCGLFGVLSLFCCIAFPVAILLGVAGITLSCLSKRGGPFSGLAIAGLVLGILSVLLGVAEFAYLLILYNMLEDPATAHLFEQLLEQYGAK